MPRERPLDLAGWFCAAVGAIVALLNSIMRIKRRACEEAGVAPEQGWACRSGGAHSNKERTSIAG